MRQLTVYLYVDQLEALQEIKERDMIPMSELIRHGIDKAIKEIEDRRRLLESLGDTEDD
jgi:hypothetical protein